MPHSCAESVTSLSRSAVAGYPGAVRRNLAIVDDSRLRCDCLKLALDHQPKRWRITDVTAVSELAALLRRGEEFDVVLLAGSTSTHIDLADASAAGGNSAAHSHSRRRGMR